MKQKTNLFALFLDDVRMPHEANCSFSYLPLTHVADISNEDWVIVRSLKEFIEKIEERGLPDVISFDHDLDYGKENVHIKEYFSAMDQNRPLNRHFLKDTGYEAALWLIEHCKKNSLTLPKYFIHSANHLGADDILQELQKYEGFAKSLQSNHSWKRPSRYPC